MLISETHMTAKSYIKIPNYCTYDTKYPNGKAHGGTVVFVHSIIPYYETYKYEYNHLQATSVVIEDHLGALTLSAIYCPPKHPSKEEHYADSIYSEKIHFRKRVQCQTSTVGILYDNTQRQRTSEGNEVNK